MSISLESRQSGIQPEQPIPKKEPPTIDTQQEMLRSNKLQLAWALYRFSGQYPSDSSEQKMEQVLEWLASPEGQAASEWFRTQIMQSPHGADGLSLKQKFLSQVTDTEAVDVPGTILEELDQLYKTSVH